jgi:SAM-dependent methyltransferase
MVDYKKIQEYFLDCFREFGAKPEGVNWNSKSAQEKRFDQISKVIDYSNPFSIIDYGCGFGSLFDYLKQKGQCFSYYGYDIVSEMIEKAKELYLDEINCTFINEERSLPVCDYVIESGIFNAKQSVNDAEWTEYVVDSLKKMNNLAKKGMACNFLTKYSDPEFMRPHLYYADPLFLFDYCKQHFSRNVALLHDYELYDFTIIIRKNENQK